VGDRSSKCACTPAQSHRSHTISRSRRGLLRVLHLTTVWRQFPVCKPAKVAAQRGHVRQQVGNVVGGHVGGAPLEPHVLLLHDMSQFHSSGRAAAAVWSAACSATTTDCRFASRSAFLVVSCSFRVHSTLQKSQSMVHMCSLLIVVVLPRGVLCTAPSAKPMDAIRHCDPTPPCWTQASFNRSCLHPSCPAP
jgi:hypothetical protein